MYKSAPKAARVDPALDELLVLVDAVRGGGARAFLVLEEIQMKSAEGKAAKP